MPDDPSYCHLFSRRIRGKRDFLDSSTTLIRLAPDFIAQLTIFTASPNRKSLHGKVRNITSRDTVASYGTVVGLNDHVKFDLEHGVAGLIRSTPTRGLAYTDNHNAL